MQLALGILLTLLLLLPGMAFRYSFDAFHPFKKKLTKLTLTESLPVFLIPSILIHSFSISLVYCLSSIFGFVIHFDSFFLLAVGHEPIPLYSPHEGAIQLVSFGLYNIFTLISGFFLAIGSIKWKTTNQLITSVFIVKNPFAELFENIQDGNNVVFLDVLVQVKEGSIIYTGLFKDYILKPDSNDLESLILTGVYRLYLKKEGKNVSQNEYAEPMEIPSDQFIIMSSQVINVNVRKNIKIIFPKASSQTETQKEGQGPNKEDIGYQNRMQADWEN